MKTRAEVLDTLRSLKGELKDQYHVLSIGIFGSYAREEQGESSDIDVLVEFGPEAHLFDYVGLSQYLEEKLGLNVDVVPKAALRPELRTRVTRDLLSA